MSTTPAPRILVRGDLRTIADLPADKAALTATVAASPYADEQGRQYVVTDEAVHSQRPVFAVRATGEWTCELVWAAGTVYRISAPGWMPDVMVYCDALTPPVDGSAIEVAAKDLIDVPGGATPVEWVTLTAVIASIDAKVATSVEEYLTAHPPTEVTDHGGLTGLADDDHPQYLTAARGDLRYPLLTDPRLTDSRTPTGAAGGGLTGTYPNPTVAALRGVTVSATAPTAGQVLTASSGTAAAWAAPAAGPSGPPGPAGILTSRGLPPSPLAGVTITPRSDATPGVVENFGGYLWGSTGGTTLYRSTDGDTWTAYCTMAASSLVRLIPTSDGEVIAFHATSVRRSSGWSSGSPTWGAVKLTTHGTAVILPWGADGDGTRFICTEYSSTRADSHSVWISLDAGVTWNVAYDSVTIHGAAGDSSHLHGVCYDTWNQTFYVSEGHNAIAGLYHSTDDGATWTRAPGMAQDPSPVVVVATDDGLCCGSDNDVNGMWGVVRLDDPMKQELALRWQWRTTQPGLIGFAQRGFRDPATGIVYMGWITNFASVAPIITGGTATAAGPVWEWTGAATAGSKIDNNVLFGSRFIGTGVHASGAGKVTITGQLTQPGSGEQNVNSGNSRGGYARAATSMAVGPKSTTEAALSTVVVGPGASATGTAHQSVVVGRSATAAGGDGVAIGYQASAAGTGSAAIGSGANTTAAFAVVVGRAATVSATGGVAVGYNAIAANNSVAIGNGAGDATAFTEGVCIGKDTSSGIYGVAVGTGAVSGGYGVAVGRNASTTTNSSVAIGSAAATTHASAVALGSTSVTTRDFQIAVGPRHFEIKETATLPSTPAADAARIYVADDGTGKTKLAVKFSDGAEHVLAVMA